MDDRRTINGVLHALKTGCRWMDMPKRYGNYVTAWRRLRTWPADDTWERVHPALLAEMDRQGRIDWRRCVIDASYVRAKGAAMRARAWLRTAPPLRFAPEVEVREWVEPLLEATLVGHERHVGPVLIRPPRPPRRVGADMDVARVEVAEEPAANRPQARGLRAPLENERGGDVLSRAQVRRDFVAVHLLEPGIRPHRTAAGDDAVHRDEVAAVGARAERRPCGWPVEHERPTEHDVGVPRTLVAGEPDP